MTPPPNLGVTKASNVDNSGTNTLSEAIFNRLYEPWCDYLTDLFLRNQVEQDGDVHVISAEVSDEFIDSLDSSIF